MNKIFGIALSAFVLASCQNSGSPKQVTPDSSSPATFNAPALPAPGSSQPASTTPAVPVTQTPAGNTATAALNPAHGAPGHRCDIPVGAPLNSPAGSAAAPVTSNPSPIQLQTPPPPPPIITQPINSNVRLNPAHGQPGHDCSIPVGQPLKS
ncbi:MAG TPA: hypothetical protein VGN63_19780 [Flavisolibacter sp.]|nr:hypothetical protein [Flavisolibacter sp.]